jgi:hypothetical protein
VRVAVMAVMIGSMGLAGYALYGSTQDPRVEGWVPFARDNAARLVALGVVAVVSRTVMQWVSSRRARRQMAARAARPGGHGRESSVLSMEGGGPRDWNRVFAR